MNSFDRIAKRDRTLSQVDLTQGRSIAHSRSTTSRIMSLLDANGQGNVHGGVIMHMVDESAAIVAVKHSQCPTVVTASVERFDFLAPAFIGDVVSVTSEMHYVGRTSMEIGVVVTAEDLVTREIRKIASSFVIYVALDENRKPTPVPPLLPADEHEQALVEQARTRRLYRQKLNDAQK